jgi:hypothetical protein
MAFDQIGLEAVLEGVQDFVSQGEAVNSSVAEMSGGMDVGASIMSAAGDVITGALMRVGEIAVESLLAAGGALVDFFSDSFAGALEAEQTIARLGQVIESTGGIAGVSVSDAQALADEFKNLSGGSDDAVLSIIDMGLRMGTISSAEMPAFIQSTLDLGAVMGDAGKAAQLMARAQEDPVGVLGALRKAGILVNEATEAQIKAMVDAGDTAGGYALLMGVVESATAGAAETMASTTAGQWAIFKETIADAGETIAGALLPAINGIAGPLIASAIPAIESFATILGETVGSLASYFEVVFTDGDQLNDFLANLPEGIRPIALAIGEMIVFVQDNMPLMQATFETVFTAISGVLQVLSDFVTVTLLPAIASIWEQSGMQLPTMQATFEGVMAGIVAATQILADFITLTLVPAFTATVDWIVANWPTIQANIEAGWAAVQPILQATIDFFTTTLIPAFMSVVDWVVTNWPTIQANVESVMNAINTVINAVLSAVIPFAIEMFNQIKAWVDVNWPIIQATIEAVMTVINSIITSTISSIVAFWTANHETIMGVAATIWDSIKLNIESAILLIEGIITATLALIRGDWAGAWTAISTTATAIWANIKAAISNSLTLVGAAITGFLTSITTTWSATWNNVVTIISTVWSNILATISSAITAVVSMFTSTDWVAVGSSIISNIATGINNLASSLASSAASAAWNAYQAMLNALGIHSPSPTLIAIGEHFGKDTSLGISKSSHIAENEAAKSGTAIAGRMIGALTSARPMVEGAANKLGNAMLGGMNLQGICNEVGVAAEKIGSQCLAGGLQLGLGLMTGGGGIANIIKDAIVPPSRGGGGSIGRGGGISIAPISTGGISTGGISRQTSNTYQYSPTYGNAPVSPERDFAMMQVLSGNGA